LFRVKEQRNILHEISKRKANWIGHILRKNCLLQNVIEGKIKGGIEVTGRRGRRRRKLLDDLKVRILSFEGGSSRLHYVESSLWKRLWTCRKTDYEMNVYKQRHFFHLILSIEFPKITRIRKKPPRNRGSISGRDVILLLETVRIVSGSRKSSYLKHISKSF
jgi:hypothetical protein